jgi:GAF domain-containing protein
VPASGAAFARREIVDQVFKQGTFITTSLADDGRSILAIPIVIRNTIGGVIYMDRGAALKPFTNSELEIVVALSNYIAVASDYSQKLNQLEADYD